MEFISEGNQGYYQDRDLPARLAERAARVTDDAEQLSISAFKSPEARALCLNCRRDLISERKRAVAFIVKKGNENMSRRGRVNDGNHVLPL